MNHHKTDQQPSEMSLRELDRHIDANTNHQLGTFKLAECVGSRLWSVLPAGSRPLITGTRRLPGAISLHGELHCVCVMRCCDPTWGRRTTASALRNPGGQPVSGPGGRHERRDPAPASTGHAFAMGGFAAKFFGQK